MNLAARAEMEHMPIEYPDLIVSAFPDSMGSIVKLISSTASIMGDEPGRAIAPLSWSEI